MEIRIPLPTSYTINTYKELYNYLKQLELAIHHAQKACEQAEKSEIKLTEDCIVAFGFPQFKEMRDENAVDLQEKYYDELQNVQLEIVIQ